MRSEVKQRIGEIIEEAIRAGDTAGALVLFREGGEETFFDAHGYANVERGEKLRRDHIFRLFSMTKPVTAVAVMTLLEKGELDIGQPVCELIPGFAGDRLIENGVERKSPTVMTVNHLLNMTSGLTYGGLGSQSEKKSPAFCWNVTGSCTRTKPSPRWNLPEGFRSCPSPSSRALPGSTVSPRMSSARWSNA